MVTYGLFLVLAILVVSHSQLAVPFAWFTICFQVGAEIVVLIRWLRRHSRQIESLYTDTGTLLKHEQEFRNRYGPRKDN